MSHEHNHSKHAHHGEARATKKGIHHTWWFWVAIVLMLGGMFMYVASLDEAIQPDGQPGVPVPADAE